MKVNTEDRIYTILSDAGLLDKDQIDFVKSKELTTRKKLLKTVSADRKRDSLSQSFVSLVDIIESLKMTSEKLGKNPVTAEIMMMAIADHLKIPFMKIDPLKLDSDVVTGVISKPYAVRHQMVPVAMADNNLTIATSNPFDPEGIDGIERTTDYKISVVAATKEDIVKIITEFFGFKTAIAAAHKEMDVRNDIGNLEQYVKLKSITDLEANDKHIISAVEYLLHYAYSQRASDIHIEPKRNASMIRFRIDGILHSIHSIPKAVHPAFVSRIKTLSRMDIAEKRRPQDGRIKTEHDGREVELRVSTLPTAFGEKVVIRIFDPIILLQDLSELGFNEHDLHLFRSFLANTHGLILVTGPTGSGKTTTLYSALKTLSTSEVNISTIEDPIEMVYDGFNQTAVNPQIDLTFANSLRTLLRQDPDIIMVGEIRDLETAQNAVQASLTGHLVLSTLHTNDAPSSVSRLIDLGVEPFLINATVIGAMAQRLVRKVCPHCKEFYKLSRDECYVLGIDYEKAGSQPVAIGRGCAECRGTGYLGRSGIFEIMEITDEIRDAVSGRISPAEIKKIAVKNGMATLKKSSLQKLTQGITTFDEIIRVTGLM